VFCFVFESLRSLITIHEHVYFSRIGSVANLLKRGHPIDTRDVEGDTALHIGVQYADVHMNRFLINAGFDINAVSKVGGVVSEVIFRRHKPAHHYACREGNLF